MDQLGIHNGSMNDRHQTKPYPLRMGEDLRAKLEEKAKEMGRSLNAEIVARLEESLATAQEDPEDVEFSQLIADWRRGREQLAFIDAELVPMQQLQWSSEKAGLPKGSVIGKWTPPPGLPEWASLGEAVAFYLSLREDAERDLQNVTAKLFLSRGITSAADELGARTKASRDKKAK